jgi:hypothetical protein
MVVHIVYATPPIGVCFDEMTYGHGCQGHCIDGKGWYCYEGDLTLIASEQPAPTTEPTPDRAMIAAMAMQGLCANHGSYGSGNGPIDIAERAVLIADAIIAELQKPKQ